MKSNLTTVLVVAAGLACALALFALKAVETGSVTQGALYLAAALVAAVPVGFAFFAYNRQKDRQLLAQMETDLETTEQCLKNLHAVPKASFGLKRSVKKLDATAAATREAVDEARIRLYPDGDGPQDPVPSF